MWLTGGNRTYVLQYSIASSVPGLVFCLAAVLLSGVASFGTDFDPRDTGLRIISPNYFQVMGIPLIKGRLFTPEDVSERPGVAIVNQATACRLWPGQDPIGKSFHPEGYPEDFCVRIIGVVGCPRDALRQGPAVPEIYLPIYQNPDKSIIIVSRLLSPNSTPAL